jgi:hypothetical protein
MALSLADFVEQFAIALSAADARRPSAVGPRSGRVYQPGIGPHPEDRAVDLIVSELATIRPNWQIFLRRCYPGSKQTCDLFWGDPAEWAMEVKMARPNGDNGKPDDTAIKDILSPFAADRSALSDCLKLAESEIAPHRAILIYGFDDTRRPLQEIIGAFETLARTRVVLGERFEAAVGPLVHPVHRAGAVFGWEVGSSRAMRINREFRLRHHPRISPQSHADVAHLPAADVEDYPARRWTSLTRERSPLHFLRTRANSNTTKPSRTECRAGSSTEGHQLKMATATPWSADG